ncbi:3228_t:CDS:2 [Funneliformis mosseae]|uniref:3228_t:CDS:1 n=1 Tax=Funneliformis mosseae TaxID=27381 RepID=A0A9N9AZ82_FUNMO|nr:3228_t:CDS:2 [Funneliformis mosseae]
MCSIRTVDSRWNELIDRAIREEAENRLKKLCIEYDSTKLSTRGLNIEYDASRTSFIIDIDDDRFTQFIGNILTDNDPRREYAKVTLHYENGTSIAEFNFGTLEYRRVRLNGKYEIEHNMIQRNQEIGHIALENLRDPGPLEWVRISS